ncbi:guanylate kinase [Kiritimatiellota bacterium B12222]|nr:guanylate kinase [Kiritimatiellota bacterium B12222]
MKIVETPHPILFLISAPSGTGKTTLCQRLLSEFPQLRYSVSSTTRAPRSGEVDGVDYDFLSREDFQSQVEQGAFLEYAEVHGNGYGTRIQTLKSFFDAGKSVLLDVDVQGADLIRDNLGRADVDPIMQKSFVDVFLSPPHLDALRERLEGRGKDAAEVIEHRLTNAKAEMEKAGCYQFQIINDDLDVAYHELRAVFIASCLRTICC